MVCVLWLEERWWHRVELRHVNKNHWFRAKKGDGSISENGQESEVVDVEEVGKRWESGYATGREVCQGLKRV